MFRVQIVWTEAGSIRRSSTAGTRRAVCIAKLGTANTAEGDWRAGGDGQEPNSNSRSRVSQKTVENVSAQRYNPDTFEPSPRKMSALYGVSFIRFTIF